MIAFCVLFIIATILTFVLSSDPMEVRWKTIAGSNCWSGQMMSNIGIMNGSMCANPSVPVGSQAVINDLFHSSNKSAATAISIVTDIVFVVVPVHVIKGVQVNKRIRWSLMGIMSLGLL